MSWIKRRGQPSPAPTNPGVPLYNPNQHVGQQPWQHANFPAQLSHEQQFNNSSNTWYQQNQNVSLKPPSQSFQQQPQPPSTGYWQPQPQQQQQVPPLPPPQIPQQQQQYNLSHPNYNPNIHANANNYPSNVTPQNQYQPAPPYSQFQPVQNQQTSYYQNAQYNSNIEHQSQIQNTTSFNPPVSQNYPPPQQYYNTNTQQTSSNLHGQNIVTNMSNQPSTEQDPWNWGWGDDSNSNIPVGPECQITDARNAVNENMNKKIAESFGTSDDTWNWSVDDSNSSSSTSNSFKHESKVPLKTKKETTLSKKEISIETPKNDMQNVQQVNTEQTIESTPVFEKVGPLIYKHRENSELSANSSLQNVENEPTNHNKEYLAGPSDEVQNVVGLDQLPPLPTGRRGQSDNLTSQWSIESQMSQDSSDDILHTSESDNRSNKLSRSSTISQSPSLPPSRHDINTDVYPSDVPLSSHVEQSSADEVYGDITYSETQAVQSQIAEVRSAIQNLTLAHSNVQFENKEIVTPESHAAPPPQSNEYADTITEQRNQFRNLTPPTKNLTPPYVPPNNPSPPLYQSNSENSVTGNPYKRVTPMSHRNTKNYHKNVDAGNVLSSDGNSQSLEYSNNFEAYTSSNSPNSFSNQNIGQETHFQNRQNVNIGVNLETIPDNSERPDQLPVETVRSHSESLLQPEYQQNHRWPLENCEVTPKNDRNQYLETGQLTENDVPDYNQPGGDLYTSNNNYQGTDTSNEINTEEPPPGLSRMVLGRTEPEPSAMSSITSDNRILTGLDRIIDGEPEENESILPNMQPMNHNIQDHMSSDDLFPGLRRMVPGESSSPLSLLVKQPRVFRNSDYDDDDVVSESELRNMGNSMVSQPSQRSETIGADTPPSSAILGGSDSGDPFLQQSGISGNRETAIGSDSVDPEQRETNVDGADTREESNLPLNTGANTQKHSSHSNNGTRRETMDGGPQSFNVRDQTDGENMTDNTNLSVTLAQDKKTGRGSRNRSISSEEDIDIHERQNDGRRKSPGRYYDRDDRDRSSPDRYHDRKSERRRYRDRYYDDDTDYYSDKERRDRRPRDSREREEYDRRYGSLRKEKDRGDKRRVRDPRDNYDRDPRRDEYYYGRYEDDYYGREGRGSRPSSRTDSYRERDRRHDQYRDHHRKPRDPRDSYQSFYQGYGGYDPYNPYYSHYQQQYQYYENLRRTNPAAYAELYRKYYANGMMGPAAASTSGSTQAYGHDDRASVHSGRSSANEDAHKDRILDQTDSSLNLEESAIVSQRLTPAKFSTAHIKANISSGHFVQILPHYPIDGQSAMVEIIDLQKLLADDDYQKELIDYPGPLVKGVTHKKTLIEYCENKIKKALSNSEMHDRDSYILMWDLLILLLRQNGVVVGTDIAELLMKNKSATSNANSRRTSVVSSVSSIHEEGNQFIHDEASDIQTSLTVPVTHKHRSHLSETDVTNKFREYLIYGSGKEALEWAMKHGLWGHALFLASKLDKRTHANVMMRFANGLTINDPLQTLYQLLSGRQPAAVTCVADEKWGDWKPHLAMILSNTSQRPELDHKAITTLGDTLQARGSLYAAHFCYLMAQVGFGKYGSKSTRLVLLGSSHQKSFSAFATNEAIMMTEIYEYACGLSEGAYNIPEFQYYKYILACRLAERGFLERALLYTERIGIIIASNPARYDVTLADKILRLAERLQARDPTTIADLQLDLSETEGEQPLGEIGWIADLKAVLNDCNMRGLLNQETQSLSNLASSEIDITQNSVTPPTDQAVSHLQNQHYEQQTSWEQSHKTNDQQQYFPPDVNQQQQQHWVTDQQQEINPMNQQYQENINYQQTSYEGADNSYQQNSDPQNAYWNNQQWSNDYNTNQQTNDVYGNQMNETQQNDLIYQQGQQQNDYLNTMAQPEEPISRPQISMPGSGPTKVMYPGDDHEESTTNVPKISAMKKSTAAAKKSEKENSSPGWFGGIWNKLSLRPKNQMKLPDDKNPSIVWDPDKKRWVNLDEGSDEQSTELKPPPKMSEMMPKMQQSNLPPSVPLSSNQLPVSNISVSNPLMQLDNNVTNGLVNQMQETAINNQNSLDESNRPPSQGNMFKMQKGRGIKKAYVDVFNPGGPKSSNNLPVPEMYGTNPTSANGNQINFFIPAPVNDPNAPIDFLMPAASQENSTEQQDNVQSSAPQMFNPNQFSGQMQPQRNTLRGRYPQH